MKLRKVTLQNVRSFADEQVLFLDGDISILIGPNGGGKTNVQDAIAMSIRRHIHKSWIRRPSPTTDNPSMVSFQANEIVSQNRIPRHSRAPANLPQRISIELEIAQTDVDNINAIRASSSELIGYTSGRFLNSQIETVLNWPVVTIEAGAKFIFQIEDDVLKIEHDPTWMLVKGYMEIYDVADQLKNELGHSPLSTAILMFPTTRTSSGLISGIALANFNDYEYKKSVDAANSRAVGSLVSLAIGRIATQFRTLLEADAGGARLRFRDAPELIKLTTTLKRLGYDWDLVTIDMRTNSYDIELTKQGSSFLVSEASSGEKELLTYIFAVYGLNVRDALIIVDEPELHLHPRWQNVLLSLFEELAADTGNQFLLATHSPVFVSPRSIKYVSRVYSDEQRSRIKRLDDSSLPNRKHLFSIVNSQNNERIFFTDLVILVEGISDRIFFEKLLSRNATNSKQFEVVPVGGKHLFDSYVKLLTACDIDYVIVADLDFAVNIGTAEIRNLFSTSTAKLKEDVIDNEKSQDAAALLAGIDEAIKTNNLTNLQSTWTYIKSRQQRLNLNLEEEQRAKLNKFISEMEAKRTYLLRKGDLECYLPNGCKSKDLEKLIQFLDCEDWWDRLEKDCQEELSTLSKALLLAVEPSRVTP